MSRFELAFRRALFLFILLSVYLTFGTILFWIISHDSSVNTPQSRIQIARQERLDFERTELLSILWAESISRTEYDWSLLANQKLDAYEKSLAEALRVSGGTLVGGSNFMSTSIQASRTFAYSFRHSLLVITTIGGIDADSLNSTKKLFTILYALLGIPLLCLYLEQCVNAIAAILPGSESARSFNPAYLLAALLSVVSVALTIDIIEKNDDDTPFIDVVFDVFLAASTIGRLAPISGGAPLTTSRSTFTVSLLFYMLCTPLIGALRVALLNIQRRIERLIGRYEFAFTQKVGQLKRVISGERLDNVVEEYREDEDSEIVDPTTVPQIDVNYNINNGYTEHQPILVDRLNSPNKINRQRGNEHIRFKLNEYKDNDEDAQNSLSTKTDDNDAVFTFKPLFEEIGEEEKAFN